MENNTNTLKSPAFGYKADPRIIPFVRPFAKTNPIFPTLLGLAYILSIFMVGFCINYFSDWGMWQAIIAYSIGLLIITRLMRTTEFLVHDGSHFSWDRKNRKLNDFLTNMLAAYPLFINLEVYRKDHVNHHKLFRSDLDSCFQRVVRTGIHEANKHTGFIRKKMLLKCFPRFIFDHILSTLSEVTNLRSICIGLLWHVFFVLLPIYLFTQSFSTALTSWGIYFWISYLFLFPVFLFFNDIQDHLYSAETEFFATTNSLGFLNNFIFSPANSGYHLLHHLFPATPLWACKKFHQKLMAHDVFYATQGKYYSNPFGSVQQPSLKSSSSAD